MLACVCWFVFDVSVLVVVIDVFVAKGRCLRACLAQSVERKTLNLVVVGSSPTVGDCFVLCAPPSIAP